MNKLALLALNKKFGGGSGSATLEELTVTKNGVYTPSGNVEFGKTYTFRENLEDVDLEALFNKVSDNGYRADLIFTNYIYDEVYIEYEGVYSLFVNLPNKGYYAYFNAKNASSLGREPGWYKDEGGWVTTQAPTITIVDKDTPNIIVVEDLSIMAPFFDIQVADGYNKVVVDVAGSDLGEITITKNGVYEPTASVELGGTYKFRDDYTDEELETLKNNNCFIESTGGDIWVSESQTDSGERYNRLAFYVYATGQSYSYRTAKAAKIDLNTETAGWYSSNQLVEAPTITIPASPDQVWGDLSALATLFVYPDGYNKINVNVEPELDEITVTKNGVYEVSKGIELGGTYTFRDNYTDDELKTLYDDNFSGVAGFVPFVRTNEISIGVQDMGNSLYYLVYASSDMSFGFAYITEKIISSGAIPASKAGWINMLTMENVDAPSVTLSVEESAILVPLSVLESVFSLVASDGWNKITVNVEGAGAAPVLEELTVTKNGVYEPVKSIELGGTYTFKNSYTDEELASLFALVTPSGSHAHFIDNSDPENSFSIAREISGDSTRYGIYAYYAVYIGEEASKLYSNGVPGWYAYDKSLPCDPPTITIPTDSSIVYASLADFELVFPIFDGYDKIVVNVEGAGAAPVLEELTVTRNGTYEPGVQYGGTYTFKEVIDEETLSKNMFKGIVLADFSNSPLMIGNQYPSADGFGIRYGNYVYIYKLGTYSSLYGVDSIGWYKVDQNTPIPVFTKTGAPTVTDTFFELIPPFSMELLLSCVEEGNFEVNVISTFTFKSDLSHIDWEQFTDFEEETRDFIGGLNHVGVYCQEVGLYGLVYNQYTYITEKLAAFNAVPEAGWYDCSGDNPVKVIAPTITLPSSQFVEEESGAIFMFAYPQELSEFFDIAPCNGYNKVTVNVTPEFKETSITITENGTYYHEPVIGEDLSFAAVPQGLENYTDYGFCNAFTYYWEEPIDGTRVSFMKVLNEPVPSDGWKRTISFMKGTAEKNNTNNYIHYQYEYYYSYKLESGAWTVVQGSLDEDGAPVGTFRFEEDGVWTQIHFKDLRGAFKKTDYPHGEIVVEVDFIKYISEKTFPCHITYNHGGDIFSDSFSNYSFNKGITIGDKVRIISPNAFTGCSITELVLTKSDINIYENSFENAYIDLVKVPRGSLSSYQTKFASSGAEISAWEEYDV